MSDCKSFIQGLLEALRKTQSMQFIKKRQFAQQSVHFEEVCDILELKDKEIGSTVISFHVHRTAQSSSRAAGNGYCPLK